MEIYAKVYWRIFLNTKKVQFAQRFIKEMEVQFGPIDVLTKQIYWKDPLLYEVEFTQTITAKDLGELICYAIIKASLLSPHWDCDFPSDLHNNFCGFGGVAHKTFRINGVKWASFSLQECAS